MLYSFFPLLSSLLLFVFYVGGVIGMLVMLWACCWCDTDLDDYVEFEDKPTIICEVNLTHAHRDNQSQVFCSICMSGIDHDDCETGSLSCEHFFHRQCITEWIHQNVENNRPILCPNCRKGLHENEYCINKENTFYEQIRDI